jgi:parallel beta-helix repeat protein
MDANFNLTTRNAQGTTLYVGGSGGGNHSTIQDAVDSASSGDTIYVYVGTYSEDLFINKSLSLVGESRLTTIIDSTGNTFGIKIENADYVNISGFTVKGANSGTIRLTNSDNSHIFNNIIRDSVNYGIGLIPGSSTIIEDNEFIGNLNGIIISGVSNENIIKNNEFDNGDGRAISFENNALDNTAQGNTITDYYIGIYVYESEGNTVRENQISDGFEGARIFVVENIVFSDNSISNNFYGINASSADLNVENCTLQNIESYNIWISDPDSVSPQIIFYNTTFDENKVMITGPGSSFLAYFRIQVKVVDEDDQSASGISVNIIDNHGGTFTKPFTTDSEGIIGPLDLFGFLETETQRNYSTPYNISAFGTNLLGWASPEVEFNAGPVITVVIYLDSDGDDVFDKDDDFPSDATQWEDNDGDGYGDNPLGNNSDAFPNDPLEWQDSDSDGRGDNSDAFPNDATEQNDSDSDGVGDNSDAFPHDKKESKDSDGDGIGDNADAFPKDPDEWEDSDSDGAGDNSDFLPDFNNNIFFLIIGIVIVIVALFLVMGIMKRRKKPVPFENEEKSE